MPDLAKLKRSRASCKAWLLREVNKLQSLLDVKEKDPEVYAIEQASKELQRRLDTWDAAQTAVELELQEAELDEDLATAGDFRDSCVAVRDRAAKLLLSLSGSGQGVTDQSDCSQASQAIKLPKLDLPRFSGNVQDWPEFWESFAACVHDSDLADISKLTYLKSLLSGDAKRCIEGLPLTSDNYSVACELLKGRFGRTEQIVFAHVQSLLSFSSADCSDLRKLQDRLLIHIRSLEGLGYGGDNYGLFLTPLILSKLPAVVRLEWARDAEGKEGDLLHLLEFLKKEVDRRERSGALSGLEGSAEATLKEQNQSSGSSRRGQNQRKFTRREDRPSSAAALQAVADVSCGFCNGPHPAGKCPDMDTVPVSDRRLRIKASGLCFLCLKGGHFARSCKARCAVCHGRHHKISCYKEHGVPPGVTQEGGGGSPKENIAAMGASLSCVPGRECSVLPTARVVVQGSKGAVEATVLFDSGSDRSYVSSSLVKKVGAKWIGSQKSSYVAFGGGKSGTSHRDMYELKVSGANLSKPSVEVISVMEVPTVCAPLQRPSVPSDVLDVFSNLDLADSYHADRQVSVDILIGLDLFWTLMVPGRVQSGGGLVAMLSVFGWVVSGLTSNVTSGVPGFTSCQLLSLGDLHEDTVRNFWSLEAVGISPDEQPASSKVLEEFDSSVRFSDGRYEVMLPWKQGDHVPELESNLSGAESRLRGLSRKLERDPDLRSSYDDVLRDMEDSGVVEEVPHHELEGPSGKTFYMPHRPVLRPESSTTKIRPVFDASASGRNGVSLNDCLETGPSLIPNLTDVLLRFRRHRFAVTGDISKAFLQISVRPEDRDCLRFLWEVEGRVRLMRFCRVPFGARSSPFLLNATVKHHLRLCPQSEVVSELRDNLYVDDWLTGADSEEKARQMFLEGRNILAQAGMTLSKCHSNSELVLDEAGVGLFSEEDKLKILGVRWDPVSDVLRYDGVGIPSEVVPTKRVVLSFLARMFDPLGFLVPFVMLIKILFQQLWLLGLGWDEPLPCEQEEVFQKWLAGLTELQKVRIPRCYMVGGACWSEVADLEIHVFADASTKGYGCVAYLRYSLPAGGVAVTFVMSRARVAPVKTVTLPRLELLACLLAARMARHVRTALELSDAVPVFCWSDSTVALAWVKSSPVKWKQFVRNRVGEIQELTDPSSWGHVGSKDNPADAASRGLFADQLISSSLWFRGPEWLRSSRETPEDCELFVTSEELAEGDSDHTPPDSSREAFGERSDRFPSPQAGAEELSCSSVLVSPSESPAGVFPVERYSSLTKAIRVVAWVRRFVNNVRHPESRELSPDLTYIELCQGKAEMIRQTQRASYPDECSALERGKSVSKSSPLFRLTPYMAEDGLIRMKGRLQMSDLSAEEKHPIILPKCHLSLLIVRFQHRLMCHAGVGTLLSALRKTYWIVSARRIARSVKHECVSCQRQDSPPCCEPAGPLPRVRVTESSPFGVTGIDFAGPLYSVDQPGKKFYICLFTCATTRAVHLELTDSLSLPAFVLALRRFASRRGWPAIIFSDNAATFRSCAARLRDTMADSAPEWRFIVPSAPWYGGWWERLVRSVKVGLRKTLGKRCLTRAELETVLHEIESCINSRPLTFVSDDVTCTDPLTPNHFLIGRGSVLSPDVVEDPENVSVHSLCERESVRRSRLEHFWRVWRKEYLRSLPAAVPGFKSRGTVREGSVVLLQKDNIPRLRWPWGVVEKLHPGRDGVVRSVDVRTPKGVYTCAVQRLHCLELVDECVDVPGVGDDPSVPCGGPSAAGDGVGVNPGRVQGGSVSRDEARAGAAVRTRSGRLSRPLNRLGIS